MITLGGEARAQGQMWAQSVPLHWYKWETMGVSVLQQALGRTIVHDERMNHITMHFGRSPCPEHSPVSLHLFLRSLTKDGSRFKCARRTHNVLWHKCDT